MEAFSSQRLCEAQTRPASPSESRSFSSWKSFSNAAASSAGRSGVTLFPDSDLAEVLARLDTGETIPPEVALAIATVLLPVLNARGR